MAGIAHFVVLFAVAVAAEFQERRVEGRGFRVAHPARNDDAVVGDGGVRGDVRAGRVAEGRLMYPGDVRGVEQVVGHVEVIAFDRHAVAAIKPPGRIAPVIDVHDFRGVGLGRFAHPDPDEAVTLFHWIRMYAGGFGHPLPTGRAGAGAGLIEGQAMVTALDFVALQTAHRQRQLAMRAGVLQRHRFAGAIAVHHDAFVKNGDGRQGMADVVVPTGDVPGVLQIRGLIRPNVYRRRLGARHCRYIHLITIRPPAAQLWGRRPFEQGRLACDIF